MGTWYRTGTVSVQNGSPDIVGVGTLWLSQASVGDIFLGPNLVEHEIASITDDTHLSVKQVNGTAAYAGTTASAQNYAIIRNFTSTLPAKLASQLAEMMTAWHVTTDELTAWLSGSGSVTVHDSVGNSYNVMTPAALNAAFNGRLVKSVAGGADVTLTSAEASNLFHELIGTRTAIGNYIVPAGVKHYFIFNNTAYSMTVKTQNGTGVSVSAGARMLLECDGANVINPLSAISGNFDISGNLSVAGVALINGDIILKAAGSTIRNLISDQGPTYSGSICMQAGYGSAQAGGAIILYGAQSAVTVGGVARAGDAVIGLSQKQTGGVGTLSSFRVRQSGNDSEDGLPDILTANNGGLCVTGQVNATATIRTGGYLVSTLPVGNVGDRAYVTDAVAPNWNGALTGGGTVVIPVFKNQTAWVSA